MCVGGFVCCVCVVWCGVFVMCVWCVVFFGVCVCVGCVCGVCLCACACACVCVCGWLKLLKSLVLRQIPGSASRRRLEKRHIERSSIHSHQ